MGEVMDEVGRIQAGKERWGIHDGSVNGPALEEDPPDVFGVESSGSWIEELLLVQFCQAVSG